MFPAHHGSGLDIGRILDLLLNTSPLEIGDAFSVSLRVLDSITDNSGYWAVMSNAVFSFAGVESIAMAAAETQNPRIAIPKACKRVFARVSIFYILSVLIVGMLVPSNDPGLDDQSGTAAQSPFVIAASAARLNGVPSLVNAIVITSAWSSSNQALLSGTRVLYGLALKNQAPKIFLRTTSWGVPYMCVLLNTTFMFLAFMRWVAQDCPTRY